MTNIAIINAQLNQRSSVLQLLLNMVLEVLDKVIRQGNQIKRIRIERKI